MSQTPLPPPGWYPQGDQERWWNGASWSDTFRPLQAAPTASYGAPYAQPGQTTPYQQPYYQAPQSSSHTLRNVLIAVGVVLVLLVGGCTAAIVAVGRKVDNVVNDDTPGGPNNPLTVTPGQGFEVAGFDYADGWQLGPDDLGDVDVTGLKVTNNRGKSDYAFVTLKLLSGNEVVADVSCTSPGSRIDEGTTITLDCTSSDDMPAAYDEVTIQDAF